MMITTAPLERWLKPDRTWSKSDARVWHRAVQRGLVEEETADRLTLRYAHIQLELIHPDLP